MSTLLIKTDMARHALAPGIRTLTPRERTLVLLADGRRTAHDLLALVAGTTAELVQGLMERGFLSAATPAAAAPEPADTDPATETPSPGQPWARSPAATKLYLMDLAERTFARSDPAQWQLLREVLCDARDDAGLLQALALVTQAIARTSGEERAHQLRLELLRA